MEVLFLIILIMLYLLYGHIGLAVHLAQAPIDYINLQKPGSGRFVMTYVFARWLPSEKIRMDLPIIYYISCDSWDTAEKLAAMLQRFGTDKGSVIELPGIDDLRKQVSIRYQLTDFELSPFPIPANKLLHEMN